MASTTRPATALHPTAAPQRFWHPLTRPSLMRRLIIAALLGFALVMTALTVLNFYRTRVDDSAQIHTTRIIAPQFAALLTEDEVRLTAQTLQQLINRDLATNPVTQQVIPPHFRIDVQGPDGRWVYQTPMPANQVPPLPADLPLDTYVNLRHQGQTDQVVRTRAGPWTLWIVHPMGEESSLTGLLFMDLLPDVLLAFPLALLPLWLTVRQGLRPLRALSQRVNARSPSDLSPLNVQAPHEELKPLVQALEDLLERVRRQVAHERRFVQDAAHELRTPLAVIANQAHVVRQQMTHQTHCPAPEELAALDHAVKRASRVVQQLLELAELDHDRPASGETIAPIDLAATARANLGDIALRAAQSHIEFSLISPEHLWRPASAIAFESVLRNWCDNALLHGLSTGGKLTVTLNSQGDTGWHLRVEDDGPGIPAEEQSLLFERFRRGRTARGTGSGLGMAITAQAARQLGATIRVISPATNAGGCALELLTEPPPDHRAP